MRTWSRIAVTSAVALALASPAFAQSTSTTPSTQNTEQSGGATGTDTNMSSGSTSTGQSSTAGAAPTASGGDVLAEQQDGQTLSSDLVGMKVTGQGDESIGEISDLIIENNQVTGAVLNVGGFLGLGAKKIGLPWDSLNVTESEGSPVASVSLSKDQLASMPEYKTLAEAQAEQSRTTTTGGTTSTQ